MAVNLEQLRGFAEIAATANFTRAAERLHIAQPTLSRQISTLETELGVELLHRARGHVALTAAGGRLLPLARRVLAGAGTRRPGDAGPAQPRRGGLPPRATAALRSGLR